MADIIWQSHSGNWDLISAVDTSYAINTISAGKNVSPNSPAMKILCTSNKDLAMFFWQKNHFTIAFLVDNRTKFYMIDPLYPKTSNNGSRNMQNAIKMLTEARINGFQDLDIFKAHQKKQQQLVASLLSSFSRDGWLEKLSQIRKAILRGNIVQISNGDHPIIVSQQRRHLQNDAHCSAPK